MRDPRKCEFRGAVRRDAGGETCRCRLVEAIGGARDAEVLEGARIGLGVCQLCCLESPPTRESPNPTVASHTLVLLDAVEARGGVAGCDVAQARALRPWVDQHLANLSAGRTAYRVPDYSGACFYLAERMSRSGARSRYRCAHELHGETTIEECRACIDYDPHLRRGGVREWCVGIVTAPRKRPTLARTVASLAAAGWSGPLVFADANTSVPRRLVPSERIVRRPVRYFGWGNYISALNEMLLIQPDADAYVLLEDDVLFSRGLRRYLESQLWPAERLAFVSLYLASHQDPGTTPGFYTADLAGKLWGSLAFVFPNASARILVRHPRVVNHRSRGLRGGVADQDLVISSWAGEVGLPIYMHAPSLTQHIGETSAIWGAGATAEGQRIASSFPGEGKDIRRVMAGYRAAQARRSRRRA